MKPSANTPTELAIAALAAAVLLGCAPRLETPNDGPDAGIDTGPIRHDDMGDGVTETTVDATDEVLWIYMDIDSGEAVEPATPEMSEAWDLGFRRFHIKMNGGVSGTGMMELTYTDDEDFATITEAPAGDVYLSDAPDDPEDEDEDPEYIFSNGDTAWFDYNPGTHVLTPKERVYVFRSVAGDYYKLQMLSYYDKAGSPAYLGFQWAPIAAPSGQ